MFVIHHKGFESFTPTYRKNVLCSTYLHNRMAQKAQPNINSVQIAAFNFRNISNNCEPNILRPVATVTMKFLEVIFVKTVMVLSFQYIDFFFIWTLA